jgi:hypothetical protein
MGIQTIPAPSAGKTTVTAMLTSGTSYTVPAGVTSLNVKLVGGGGGGGGSNIQQGVDGEGGTIAASTISTTPGATITYAIGAGGTGGAYNQNGGTGGTTSMTGATSATGGIGGTAGDSFNGPNTNILGISAGNGGRGGASAGGNNRSGGNAAPGAIYIEYWV